MEVCFSYRYAALLFSCLAFCDRYWHCTVCVSWCAVARRCSREQPVAPGSVPDGRQLRGSYVCRTHAGEAVHGPNVWHCCVSRLDTWCCLVVCWWLFVDGCPLFVIGSTGYPFQHVGFFIFVVAESSDIHELFSFVLEMLVSCGPTREVIQWVVVRACVSCSKWNLSILATSAFSDSLFFV